MNTTSSPSSTGGYSAGGSLPAPSSWKKKLLIICAIVLGVAGLSVAATAWWVKRNIYASALNPVQLSEKEQVAFDQKVQVIKAEADEKTSEQQAAAAKRTLTITEKEINSYLAKQGVGESFKVSLGDGDASVTVLAPVDKDVPVIGGTTVRVRVALNARMDVVHNCSLSFTDVSLGGISVPNAWLGGMKGVNLLASNVESDPLARKFIAGIREFEIKDGAIRVLLNE